MKTVLEKSSSDPSQDAELTHSSVQNKQFDCGNTQQSFCLQLFELESRVRTLERELQKERLANEKLRQSFVPIVLGIAGDIRTGSTHFSRSLIRARKNS
eukprot:6213346-Pleurochrysis_carterae.AAC.4